MILVHYTYSEIFQYNGHAGKYDMVIDVFVRNPNRKVLLCRDTNRKSTCRFIYKDYNKDSVKS